MSSMVSRVLQSNLGISAYPGTVVSTVMIRAVDGELVLQAASVAVAVRLCTPSASGEILKLQSPLTSALAVPIGAVSFISNNSTVLPTSAVPFIVIVTVLVFIVAPLTGEVITGASGAVVSVSSLPPPSQLIIINAVNMEHKSLVTFLAFIIPPTL